ncbi:putative signal transduction histidine kinase [Allomuricauda ruestringensis DSM 13258]|uniref:Signal transduction histidine kinase n=2 Tax=Flagellimonas TaxID=444459 RepID=G2PIK9_ALLRU|nr:putative signal transduction histidine kinase [Allomuricauda ruestringensis DSM 13258]
MIPMTNYIVPKQKQYNFLISLIVCHSLQSTSTIFFKKVQPCSRAICLFLSLLSAALSAQTTELERATKKLPVSYLMVKDSGSKLVEVLNNHSFKPVQNVSLEVGPTYWFEVDFKNELDTLHTQKSWRLRTTPFNEATLYYLSGDSITQKNFGQFNQKGGGGSLIYPNGVLFQQKNLISGRYLYIKCRMYSPPSNPAHFEYLSNTSNRFYTDYYTGQDINKLTPSLLYLGACSILFLTFLVVYLNIKKVEFLFYSLYVLFSAIYLAGMDTPTFNTLFESKAGFWIVMISQVFINLFYLLFAKYYLATAQHYPQLNSIINIAVVFLTLVTVVHFLTYFLSLHQIQGNILNVQRLFMTLFGLFSMLYLLYKAKDKLAIFIVVGSFIFMLGALAYWFIPNKYYMMGGSILEIIIFSLGLAYKIKLEYDGKLELQKEVSLKEISVKRAQMNPHFFFNSLSSIQHLILINNKTAALNYLTKFGKLARNVLESSYQTTVTLADEIELLHSYLELESLRFDNAFSYTITVDDPIDLDSVEIPLMLVQPFVENAIIHGLVGKKDGEKTLELRFLQEGEYYVIEIEDNGIGRQYFKSEEDRKKSRGMEITKKRLKMLDKSDQHKNTIEIIDKFDSNSQPSGTKVTIRLYNP